MKHRTTPDGRYFLVRGRLWRCTNPALPEDERQALVRELMAAWRVKKTAKAADDLEMLRHGASKVDAAKVALGERGPVWWTDGAPDYNRKMARNTPYAAWERDDV